MHDRKQKILKAIIKEFISTAEPVGSNAIMVSYNFQVSPATIRNDMACLEKEGMIFQPHTSAGRIPTTKGYRHFVDELIDYDKARVEALQKLSELKEGYLIKKVKERIYDAVSLLSQSTEHLSFATLSNNRTFYLGLANALKQPEFKADNMFATQVVEVIEDNDNFLNILHNLPINHDVKTFIGEENIIAEMQSCSIIATKYEHQGYEGFLGILGPTRMKYAYNTVILEEIKKILTIS